MVYVMNRLTPRCSCCPNEPQVRISDEFRWSGSGWLIGALAGERQRGADSQGPSSARASTAASASYTFGAGDSSRAADAAAKAAPSNSKQSFLTVPDKKLTRVKPPDGALKLPLHSYQEEALGWMLECEREPPATDHPLFLHRHSRDKVPFFVHKYRGHVWAVEPMRQRGSRGGILADDMGVG